MDKYQKDFSLEDKSILLISHGAFEKYQLETLAEKINCSLRYAVIIKEGNADLGEFYDPIRRQYDANKILKHLTDLPKDGIIKTIGLFRVDLFIPILTYIFGQAIFKGDTGLVSVYRLRNEQYGLKADEELLLERLVKVVIHELGHSFGLIHCHAPNCVMRSSTYVEDVDQKSERFCTSCREAIGLLPYAQ